MRAAKPNLLRQLDAIDRRLPNGGRKRITVEEPRQRVLAGSPFRLEEPLSSLDSQTRMTANWAPSLSSRLFTGPRPARSKPRLTLKKPTAPPTRQNLAAMGPRREPVSCRGDGHWAQRALQAG
jgi:hypothetical protein